MKTENAKQIIDYIVTLTAPLPKDEHGLKESRILVLAQAPGKYRGQIHHALLEAAVAAGMAVTRHPSSQVIALAYRDLRIDVVLRTVPVGRTGPLAALEGAEFTACIVDCRLYESEVEAQLITRCGRYPSVQACREGKIMTMIVTDKLA